MSDKQVRDYDKFMLRFPDGMRDSIAERAKANGRSMNSEIVQILEDELQRSAMISALAKLQTKQISKVELNQPIDKTKFVIIPVNALEEIIENAVKNTLKENKTK